ncbi:MAG TPA: SGNH/GDSL hydrolase family protein [Marmoricola sp.]|nr:SGNH/GDSL hydrolase family protein [Marmoricola sp.]
MSSRRRVLTVAALLLSAACAAPAAKAGRPTNPTTPGTGTTSSSTASSSPGPTVRVVGLGDSVMAGTNCDCAGLAEEYGTALQARDGGHVDVTNLGEGGKVTEDLLEDLQVDVPTRTAIAGADVVLVTIGANDLLPQLDQWRSSGCDESCFAGPAAQMGQNLRQILTVIDAIRDGHHGTVLVTDYWNVFTDGDVARNSGGQAQLDWSDDVTAAANQQICAAASASGDTCVDLVPVFKPGGSDPTSLLADDGDHPNAAGVQATVQALLAHTPTQP